LAIKITWDFRKCEVGEIYLQQGGNPLCFACPYHTYSFSDPYVGKSCVPIPTQGKRIALLYLLRASFADFE